MNADIYEKAVVSTSQNELESIAADLNDFFTAIQDSDAPDDVKVEATSKLARIFANAQQMQAANAKLVEVARALNAALSEARFQRNIALDDLDQERRRGYDMARAHIAQNATIMLDDVTVQDVQRFLQVVLGEVDLGEWYTLEVSHHIKDIARAVFEELVFDDELIEDVEF